MCYVFVRTGALYLCNETLVVTLVEHVRRLARLVRSVQQAPVLGVTQQQLENATTASANRDVQRRVASLKPRHDHVQTRGRLNNYTCRWIVE